MQVYENAKPATMLLNSAFSVLIFQKCLKLSSYARGMYLKQAALAINTGPCFHENQEIPLFHFAECAISR